MDEHLKIEFFLILGNPIDLVLHQHNNSFAQLLLLLYLFTLCIQIRI